MGKISFEPDIIEVKEQNVNQQLKGMVNIMDKRVKDEEKAIAWLQMIVCALFLFLSGSVASYMVASLLQLGNAAALECSQTIGALVGIIGAVVFLLVRMRKESR